MNTSCNPKNKKPTPFELWYSRGTGKNYPTPGWVAVSKYPIEKCMQLAFEAGFKTIAPEKSNGSTSHNSDYTKCSKCKHNGNVNNDYPCVECINNYNLKKHFAYSHNALKG